MNSREAAHEALMKDYHDRIDASIMAITAGGQDISDGTASKNQVRICKLEFAARYLPDGTASKNQVRICKLEFAARYLPDGSASKNQVRINK
jgi:hypothetical protein